MTALQGAPAGNILAAIGSVRAPANYIIAGVSPGLQSLRQLQADWSQDSWSVLKQGVFPSASWIDRISSFLFIDPGLIFISRALSLTPFTFIRILPPFSAEHTFTRIFHFSALTCLHRA
jgi:hypothetical protein